jgi:hypothetical protein
MTTRPSPDPVPQTPASWPLRDRAAQAIRDSNGSPEALEWWRAHPQLVPAHVYADAVLSVLPPPADRATVYAEVAERLAADAEQGAKEGFTRIYRRSAAKQVREWAEELAAEAQPEPETGADLIENYLRFLRGQGPEPDLSDLPAEQREAITGQLRIVRALADRDPNLPPIDRDPVARRLGLHQPASGVRQPDTETLPLPEGPEYTPCACGHIEPEHRQQRPGWTREACLLCACVDYAPAIEQPDQATQTDAPSGEQVVREHVTTLHLIGEQLAGVESWMWEHLAYVRAHAVSQAPQCDVEFEGGGRCAKPAGHRPPGSDDPHAPAVSGQPAADDSGEGA